MHLINLSRGAGWRLRGIRSIDQNRHSRGALSIQGTRNDVNDDFRQIYVKGGTFPTLV